MSIVRVGLAETKKFAEGYEAIFGKRDRRAPAQKAKSKKNAAVKGKKRAQKKR